MMERTTFLYNKITCYGICIWIISCAVAFSYVFILSLNSESWVFSLSVSIIIIAMIILFFYLVRKYAIPASRGEIALELDNKKLQFNVSNKIIYWSDVFEFSLLPSNNKPRIRFHFKDGQDDIVISLGWVAGKSKDIISQIQEYFDRNFVPLPL